MRAAAVLVGLTVAAAAVSARAKSGGEASDGEATKAEGPGGDDAAGADGDAPRRELVHFNEYRGPYFSIRVGGGFLVDFATYAQDSASAEQLDLAGDAAVRDARVVAKGRFGPTDRLTYTVGYMYDGPTDSWRFRQTGLQLALPGGVGRVFVGRTKEGISLSKIMVGYQGWTLERATANDAFIPILADGVKWMGNSPGGALLWSLGAFADWLSDKESFNKNDKQIVARVGWLPFGSEETDDLLHLGLALRYALANDGALRYRAKPEAFPAQSFAIDTGKFVAERSYMAGLEAYYRPGPLMFGAEYLLNQVDARAAADPFFHGGEIFVAYLLTGETRPYNAQGGYFERVSPNATVFSGGPGAWELVARFSYTDLDAERIRGGTFWRITPMVNWHLSDNVRLELAYGFGVLHRFGEDGRTHFLQGRMQLQL